MASNPNFKTAAELIKEAQNVSDMIKEKEAEESKLGRNREATTDEHVWLVSCSWFEKWKEATGFDLLNTQDTLNEEDAKTEIELPPLNHDLIDYDKQKSIGQVGRYLPAWSHYNIVLKLGIEENIHFMYVNQRIWNYICLQYPDAIEVKRQAYVNVQGYTHYEIFGHLVKEYLL